MRHLTSKYIPYIVHYLREEKKLVQYNSVEATLLMMDEESSQRSSGALTIVRIVADVLRCNIIYSENTNSRHWKGT